MAEVTEMQTLNGAPPPINGAQPPKRGKGRPPGSKNKTAAPEVAADEAEDEAPEPETEISGSSDFWLMLQNFSDDEWNNLSAYLYRVAPKIDRKANGRPSNIQIYSSRFTPDDIMKEHGSGAYSILLNRMDPGSGKYFRVAVGKVTIINPKYPPVVPDGDWVEDKCNDMWKWGANPVPLSNGSSGPRLQDISEMMDKAEARAERMIQLMKPKEDTTTAVILQTLLESALNRPAAPPPDTTQHDALMQMLMEDRKQQREELAILREKLLTPPPPQKSIIEQFIELRPQLKDLAESFGGRAAKSDPWAEIAKEGIAQVPDLIALGRDMINKPPAPQPTGVGNHQPQQIAAPAAAASSEPPTKPIAEMTDDEKRAYIDHLWKKWGPRLLQISTRLVEEFTVKDEGYSFRDWYVEMYGKLNWADLKRDLDPEIMTNMYIAHPQLQKALTPPVRLLVFLREFVTDFDAEDDTPMAEKLAAAMAKPGAVEEKALVPADKPGEAK